MLHVIQLTKYNVNYILYANVSLSQCQKFGSQRFIDALNDTHRIYLKNVFSLKTIESNQICSTTTLCVLAQHFDSTSYLVMITLIETKNFRGFNEMIEWISQFGTKLNPLVQYSQYKLEYSKYIRLSFDYNQLQFDNTLPMPCALCKTAGRLDYNRDIGGD